MAASVAILSGPRLREILGHRNITQARFAADIGIHPVVLSAAILGKPVSPEVVYKIAVGISLLRVIRRAKKVKEVNRASGQPQPQA